MGGQGYVPARRPGRAELHRLAKGVSKTSGVSSGTTVMMYGSDVLRSLWRTVEGWAPIRIAEAPGGLRSLQRLDDVPRRVQLLDEAAVGEGHQGVAVRQALHVTERFVVLVAGRLVRCARCGAQAPRGSQRELANH